MFFSRMFLETYQIPSYYNYIRRFQPIRAEIGMISCISCIRGSDNPSVFLIEVHFVLSYDYKISAFHPCEAEHLIVQQYCHSVCFHV